MNSPLLLSALAILVAVVAIIFVYVRKSERNAGNKLAEFSKKIGLTFEKGTLKKEPALKGIYRGVPIVVQSVVVGSGSSFIYTTTYTATLSAINIPLDLIAYREGIMSKLGKAFGGEDIQLDDKELDETFIIKGTSHHNIRQFFARSTMKPCFLAMSRETDSFRFENKSLFFEFPYRLLDAEEDLLKSHLDKVIVYANTINNSASDQPDLSKPGFAETESSDLLGESTTLEVFVPTPEDMLT